MTSAPMRTMPGLVEVLEGLLADVGNVAGDLFLAELGVAGDALELLDVDRGEDVLLDQRSDTRMESSKLYPPHGMNATSTFWPRASSPLLGGRSIGDDVALA